MPNVNIGNIELSVINSIDPSQEITVEEIDVIGFDDPIVVEHTPEFESLSIEFMAIASVHSDNLPIDDQRENILALLTTDPGHNTFQYLDWQGWLIIDDISISKDPNMTNIREGSLSAYYVPYHSHKQGYEVETKHVESNVYDVDTTGWVAIPTFVNNIGTYTTDSAGQKEILSEATLASKDGEFSYYKIHPFLDASDGTLSGSASITHEPTFRNVQAATLTSQGDSVTTELGYGVPESTYHATVRVNDDNVSSDVTISIDSYDGTTWTEEYSDTFSTGTSATTNIKTGNPLIPDCENVRVTVEKATSNANTIDVDGVTLYPHYKSRLIYEVDVDADLSTDSSVNITGDAIHVPSKMSPCRVYDDNGSATESDWDSIWNTSHTFDGDAVVENGIIRINLDNGDIEVYDNSAWTKVISGGSLDYSIINYSINKINLDVVSVDVVVQDANSNYYRLTYELRRGQFTLVVTVQDPTPKTDVEFSLTQNYPYCAEVDEFYHSDEYSGSVDRTDTDAWLSMWGPTKNHIASFSSANGNVNGPYVGGSGMSRIQYTISDGDKLYWSFVPHTSPSFLADSNPPAGSGVAEHTYSAGTDLEHGTYLIAWGISSVGGESVDITTEVDAADVSVDDKGATWSTSTTTSKEYYFRFYETDSAGTFSSVVDSASPGNITVHDVALVPLTADTEIGVQEAVYEAFSQPQLESIVRQRDGYSELSGAGIGGSGEGGAGI